MPELVLHWHGEWGRFADMCGP